MRLIGSSGDGDQCRRGALSESRIWGCFLNSMKRQLSSLSIARAVILCSPIHIRLISHIRLIRHPFDLDAHSHVGSRYG